MHCSLVIICHFLIHPEKEAGFLPEKYRRIIPRIES